MRSLQALGWLLTYPDEALRHALPEIEVEIRAEPGLGAQTRAALLALLGELREDALIDLEERYVALFDRTRGLSLHLHEHVHGESRERAGALVQLHEVYQRAGLELLPGELPDYLPALCEFLSLRPPGDAHALLSDAASVLQRVRGRLEQRGSPYAAVLAALLELSGTAQPQAADPDPESGEIPGFAALDAAWEDAPVTFGADGGAQSCATPGSPGAAPGSAGAPRPDLLRRSP